MEAPISPTDYLVLDANGRLDQDAACISCGYNLRGLDPDSVCPECASPIGLSVHGDFLRYSDPAWVERLASGMNWIVGAMLLGFVFGIIGAGLGAVIKGPKGVIAEMLPSLAASAVGLVGYWRVTEPDPRRLNPQNLSARGIARNCAVIAFALGILQTALRQDLPTLFGILAVVSGLVGVVFAFAMFIYARSLALRIPDKKLASRTRFIMWGYVVATGLIILTVVVGIATAVSTQPGATVASNVNRSAFSLFAGLGCFAGALILLFGLLTLSLILRYRRALKTAAREARETWARHLDVATGEPVGL